MEEKEKRTYKVIPEAEAKEIIKAICYLANRCDGAHALDGAGFNKVDSEFGRQMADIHWNNSQKGYSLAQMNYMAVLRNKYRRQLTALQ